MKKLVVAGIALSFLMSSIAAPKRAEAMLGAITVGIAPLAVIGGAGILSGTLLAYSGLDLTHRGCSNGILSLFTCPVAVVVGALTVASGALLLDGNSAQNVAFTAVSADDAKTLGLCPAEMTSFNAELLEINAVRESVQGEVVSEVRAGKPLAQIDIHALWQGYRDTVAPETFSALQKISDHIVRSMQATGER